MNRNATAYFVRKHQRARYNLTPGGGPAPQVYMDFRRHVFAGRRKPSDVTCTRASVGYAQSVDGSWGVFQNNVPRVTNLGLLVEEARTNSVRNNSAQGAVAGLLSAGGALPTNWAVSFSTSGCTTANVTVGTTTVLGVDCLSLTFNFTAAATTAISLVIENTPAALNADVWTGSVFHAVTAGSCPRGIAIEVDELDGAGAFLAGSIGSTFFPTSTLTRTSQTRTNNNASTAKERIQLRFNVTNLDVVSYTLLIGWPQLEKGAHASSPLRTTSAAVARAADQVTVAFPSFTTPYTVLARATPLVPINVGNAAQTLLELDDGTANNRAVLRRLAAANAPSSILVAGGVTQSSQSSGAWNTGASGKIAMRVATGAHRPCFNSTLLTLGAPGALPTITAMRLGGDTTATAYFNGYVERVEAWTDKGLSDDLLQRSTSQVSAGGM